MFSWLTVLTVSCGALLVVALFSISRNQSDRSLFGWGVVLICARLVASLLGPVLTMGDPSQLDYVKNAFLVIASIGANIVATSVTQQKKTCCPPPVAPAMPKIEAGCEGAADRGAEAGP